MSDKVEVYLAKKKSAAKGDHAEKWQHLETCYVKKCVLSDSHAISHSDCGIN
jgi:sarcosine oxidase delta subunit